MAKKRKKAGTSAKVTASKKVESKVEAKPAGWYSPPPPESWRDTIPIHPAAEQFPLMSPAELKELAEDIRKNGLNERVAVWRADPDSPWQLLDGRNRLDALDIVHPDGWETYVNYLDSSVDPYAYVISANIKRRHLNVEQRQQLLITLIARAPEKSNRQIGKEIGVDHKTIATARAEGEDVGRIPHVETHTDTRGREQPAHKSDAAKKAAAKKAAAKKAAAKKAAEAAAKAAEEEARAAAEAAAKAAAEAAAEAAARANVGENGASEAARLRARNDELERDKSRLERQNLALHGEVGEAKAGVHLAEDVRDFLDALVAHVANTDADGEPRKELFRALHQFLADRPIAPRAESLRQAS
jgi:hypothetical protein